MGNICTFSKIQCYIALRLQSRTMWHYLNVLFYFLTFTTNLDEKKIIEQRGDELIMSLAWQNGSLSLSLSLSSRYFLTSISFLFFVSHTIFHKQKFVNFLQTFMRKISVGIPGDFATDFVINQICFFSKFSSCHFHPLCFFIMPFILKKGRISSVTFFNTGIGLGITSCLYFRRQEMKNF